MRKSFVITATLATCLFFVSGAQAGDLEWSGNYRAEAIFLTNTALDENSREKAYGLHHFVLKPRIVAADGLFINSRFDIFNYDNSLYPSAQLGQRFGSSSSTANADADKSALGQAGPGESIRVTHLYMTLVQEFGSLIAGRTPMHFGLGLTHNAGTGLFDHWLDTSDIVGYKMVMGNVFLFPMIGKVNEGDLTGSDDVTDYMVHLQYDNPETDAEMGIFYHSRKAGQSGASTLPTDVFGDEAGAGAGATVTGGMSINTINAYYKKTNPMSHYGFEASLLSGDTGVSITATGQKVKWEALGVAAKGGFQSGKWDWNFDLGYASGDDATSANKYEGYLFDRNYDVAMLLFNQELGQDNYLRTALNGTDPGVATSRNNPDIETISNVFYFAPSARYQWKDKYAIDFTVATGWLNQTLASLTSVETDTSLGYEVDIALDYKPNNRMSWRNEIGILFPGSAFETDSTGATIETKTSYGFVSKAAISF